ncbi:MAG TPA: hypothetical protein PK014_14115 [Thermoanaerobaculia bacterium]|nr:hypothetical protein [Thermoanaerobaculia bacterium]HUM31199.1 hypothetical protein [Thermoanaerobaculia bacterium]HXK69565.1 hypothetical protein [Thermoanaerobaculia bacterium]
MSKKGFSLLAREFVLFSLCALSLIPVIFLSVVADHLSINLYLMQESLAPNAPHLTEIVARLTGGYHGLSMEILFILWLLLPISFFWLLSRSTSSLEFRVKFLSIFSLVWVLIFTYLSMLAAAFVAPRTPLYARLEESGWLNLVSYILYAEIIIFCVIPFIFLFRVGKTEKSSS